MENNILTNNLSTIKVKKIKIQNSEYPQNKLANSLTDFINSNQRFMERESESVTINPKKPIKNINSYFYFIPKKKIFEFKKVINVDKNKEINYRNKDYILPVISNKNLSVKSYKENKGNQFEKLKPDKIKMKKQKHLLINPISLDLYTLTNEQRNKKLFFNKKNSNSKIKDEFLEKIKDYRKRLKDQMIKRNKFQYSHSNNNSFNNNNNQNQSKKKMKEPDKEKENEENRFNYHQDNKYIFHMNENVGKALNNFYHKLKNHKMVFGTDKDIINTNPGNIFHIHIFQLDYLLEVNYNHLPSLNLLNQYQNYLD